MKLKCPSCPNDVFTLHAGYSVASGEFSGDDDEGEGHIYSATFVKLHG